MLHEETKIELLLRFLAFGLEDKAEIKRAGVLWGSSLALGVGRTSSNAAKEEDLKKDSVVCEEP